MDILSPSQQLQLDKLEKIVQKNNISVFWGYIGLGKTTILKALHKKIGGPFLSIGEFLQQQYQNPPLSIEESLGQLLTEAVEKNEIVLVDDLLLLDNIANSSLSSRRGMLDLVLNLVCSTVIEKNKKIVFTHTSKAPASIDNRCFYVGYDKFTVEDYQFFSQLYLNNTTNVDFAKIYRFAPRLNGHQLKAAFQVLGAQENLTTETFTDYLLEHHLLSNVSVGEVEKVDLEEIKGMDDVIQTLETHVILPLEEDALAKELDLKHKKGVLLYGPPGTGKTSIGRMLAHRLKGKFFSIDGRFVSGSKEFYQQVREVFEAAKQNAPSIIFIDEADVFWSDYDQTGLYRYLLTELDGIEGTRAGTICVMITAMDLLAIPPALVRSGRIELWLELSLPDESTRREILKFWIDKLAKPLQEVDLKTLSRRTEDFSGADLRRITEDVKNLYAYDKIKNNSLLTMDEYYSKVIKTIRTNQEKRDKAQQDLKTEYQQSQPLLSFVEFLNKMPNVINTNI